MSENTELTTEKITESNGFKKLKEDVVSSLEFIFKVSLGFGSAIAFCFYSFCVGAMPSIGNIGDITIFLVMIAGVSIIIAGVFVVASIPTLVLTPKSYVKYLEKEVHLCFSIKAINLFFMLVAFMNIVWMVLIKFCLTHENKDNFLIWWWVCFFLPLFILLAMLIRTKESNKSDLFSVLIISFFNSLSISLYTLVSLYYFEKSMESLVYSMVFIVIVTFLNIAIVKAIPQNFKPETSEQDKLFYRWLPMVSSIIVIVIFSLILVYQKQEVFFVTKPFELLKLGHYNATLQFKEDFIQKDNPFSKSNLKNCKEGYFFIRSSIGDEYILQEFEERKENNTTNKVPLKPKSDVYRIKKEFVLAESKLSFDANGTWTTDNGCDSYEKVTFKKEFIKNNNPFIENEKGCLTKTFWVRDRGATLELKDINDTESNPYQISSIYIMSRKKVQDQNTTWADCPPKISKSNAPSAVLCQIRCDNNQSKNNK